jgi:hypothetical protein
MGLTVAEPEPFRRLGEHDILFLNFLGFGVAVRTWDDDRMNAVVELLWNIGPAAFRRCGHAYLVMAVVRTCSGRMPSPRSRAGTRRNHGIQFSNLATIGGLGVCVEASVRAITRF